ncbi:ATP phosphoribosyltransferase regulatory subunit [Campylobacter lanienae]|uniref:ATP phosphoribosyltransferase regulatory subunit n=1 Tax=Campylobacter lanienae TaxID=75658 RepID=UPI000BB400DB|nr:ATP phosphoribosyltransferase regulatory subunit [Campylobacter lanienae]
MNLSTQKIYEHDIPDGSKLYFGSSAKLKRRIESKAADILEDNGFSEIITPYFSHHQRQSVKAENLIRFSDKQNSEIALRSDSTIDVVRIATKRLKDSNTKRWFYIQPVFKYPNSEIYQIGAEILGDSSVMPCIDIVGQIFKEFGIEAHLQISNIQIPKIICQLLNLPISVFENGRLEVILGLNLPWLNLLANIKSDSDIDSVIAIAPSELKEPLSSMKGLANNYEKRIYAPLYYSKMRYYDKLFFRFLCDNSVLSSGGSYEIDGNISAGFAIFSDAVIENLRSR